MQFSMSLIELGKYSISPALCKQPWMPMWLLWILTFLSFLTHLGTNQPLTFENQPVLECHVFSNREVIFDSYRKEVAILCPSFSYYLVKYQTADGSNGGGLMGRESTGTEDDLVLLRSLFGPTRTRKPTSANANNSSWRKTPQGAEYFQLTKLNRSQPCYLPATKNYQGDLEDSEDEGDAKILSIHDFKTGQQSAPHIQLEMPRHMQSQQGNA